MSEFRPIVNEPEDADDAIFGDPNNGFVDGGRANRVRSVVDTLCLRLPTVRLTPKVVLGLAGAAILLLTVVVVCVSLGGGSKAEDLPENAKVTGKPKYVDKDN